MVLITGMRLPNKTVVPAPIFLIAAFQHKKETTDVPAPKYINDIKSVLFQTMGASLICSIKKPGNINNVPKPNMASKKVVPDMVAGFFLTSTLYTANAIAPASAHMSPTEKVNDNRVCKLPLEISNNTPDKQMSMPVSLNALMRSPIKIMANTVAKIGEDVVLMSAILMAVV